MAHAIEHEDDPLQAAYRMRDSPELQLGLPNVAAAAIVFLVYLALVFGTSCVAYFLLTLPMRRRERARLFLDLIELGLKDGRSAETTIMALSHSRDRKLGVRFYLLAAFGQPGRRQGHALEMVPRMLPPQIVAMLKAGETIGDISKVLPACRRLLHDGVSQIRGAINYLVLLAFGVTPLTIFIPIVLRTKVLPSYKAVFEGVLDGQALPAFTRFVLENNGIAIALQTAFICIVWIAMFIYIAGPRVQGWLARIHPGIPGWISWQLPWRRKRLHRDFSSMLAVLLDAGVPESEAVRLAGESTNNVVMQRRAGRVCELLSKGVKLPEAVCEMGDSQELSWRLSNALRSGRDFLRALAGWHEALDAKAFQLEQAAAQTTTTAMVLINGVLVGGIVIALFLALIQLVNEAVLW
jgi:type II secretory pathway component PulF